MVPSLNGSFSEKVAIIGAGPAGLSCAFYLAEKGYSPVIFEKNEKPGGMLRYGIPSFKLEKDVIDAEIDIIKAMGVEIYSVSTDTHFVHKAWHDTSESIRKINYPMLADPTGVLSRGFGVMIEEEGVAYRGTFVVNPEGKVKLVEIQDNSIGRNAEELLRKVAAAQFVEAHPGEVCPAKWQQGAETLKPSIDLVGKI